MPSLPISGLPAGAALGLTNPVPTVQAGVTVKATAEQFLDLGVKAWRPSYRASTWYPTLRANAALGSAIATNAQAKLYPFTVPQRVTVDQLGAVVTTVAAASNFQLAIFANDLTLNRPTGLPLAYTAPTMSGAVAGAVTAALNVSLQFDPSLVYWAAIATDTTTLVFQAWSTSDNFGAWIMGGATIGAYAAASAVQNEFTQATHTFANNMNTLNINPATVIDAGATVVRAAMAHIRVASVP